MKGNYRWRLLSALGFLLSSVPSHGALVTYSNRALFNLAAPGFPVETFEAGLVAAGGVTVCTGPLSSASASTCFPVGALLVAVVDQLRNGRVDQIRRRVHHLRRFVDRLHCDVARLLSRECLDAQVLSNHGAVAVESPLVFVCQGYVRMKLKTATYMINYDAGDFLQRREVVKPLEALQQHEKTEHVVIDASAGLRELSFRIRWRKRLLEFAGGDDGAEARIRSALDGRHNSSSHKRGRNPEA
jgi:hypothetical protein